jgi:hypothetical protein
MLIDIDGVLHVGSDPIAGARELLEALCERGVPFRLVTNTTSRSRRLVVEGLQELGFELNEAEVLTPAALAVRHCRARGYERVALHVGLGERSTPLAPVGRGERHLCGEVGRERDGERCDGARRRADRVGGNAVDERADRRQIRFIRNHPGSLAGTGSGVSHGARCKAPMPAGAQSS